jgi:iron complex outermembrane receptor protein
MRAAGERSFDNANLYEEDVYAVFDAKIGYLTEGWDFYVYGKNLTDEEYIISFGSSARQTLAEYGQPLTIGVGLRYRF